MAALRLLLVALGGGLAPCLMAAESAASSALAAGDGLLTANPWQVIVSLFLVIGLILALAWLARRIGGASLVGGQHMKVLASMPVGTRERVLLIDVAGKQLLLGVAPGRVSCLHEFDQPVVDAGAGRPSEFANKMKQFLQSDKSS